MDTNTIAVLLMGYVGYILKEIPRRIFNILLMISSFSFTTSSKDRDVYNGLNSWLLALNKRVINDNLNAKLQYTEGVKDEVNFSINYGIYFFLYKRNICVISKELIENNWDISDNLTIRVIGLNKKVVKQEIIAISNKINTNDNMVKIYPTPDIWDNYNMVKKSFDDVFIKDKEYIMEFLDNWKTLEKFYNDHGIVYKTGILMYGKPGTGKTSTARAIASYMDMDIHIINLNSYKEEQGLIRKIISIPPKSVILFEDIDCILKDRDDKSINDPNREALLATILNILDGVMSPSGSIFIATSNHYDKLDEALIRNGRFDTRIEISDIDVYLAKEMCDRFGVDYDVLHNEIFPINPSHLQVKIMKKLRDKNNFIKEMI